MSQKFRSTVRDQCWQGLANSQEVKNLKNGKSNRLPNRDGSTN